LRLQALKQAKKSFCGTYDIFSPPPDRPRVHKDNSQHSSPQRDRVFYIFARKALYHDSHCQRDIYICEAETSRSSPLLGYQPNHKSNCIDELPCTRVRDVAITSGNLSVHLLVSGIGTYCATRGISGAISLLMQQPEGMSLVPFGDPDFRAWHIASKLRPLFSRTCPSPFCAAVWVSMMVTRTKAFTHQVGTRQCSHSSGTDGFREFAAHQVWWILLRSQMCDRILAEHLIVHGKRYPHHSRGGFGVGTR
jgi:hypothetical protein